MAQKLSNEEIAAGAKMTRKWAPWKTTLSLFKRGESDRSRQSVARFFKPLTHLSTLGVKRPSASAVHFNFHTLARPENLSDCPS